MFPVRLRKFANKSAELSVSLVQNAVRSFFALMFNVFSGG